MILRLKIADISIQLNLENRADVLFLKDKYKDYVSNIKKVDAVVNVRFNDIKKNSTVFIRDQDDSYTLFSHPLKTNFAYFNDVFLQVFFAISHENNGCVVHASTLIKNRKAYIFMGKEGAGKSTIRQLCKSVESLGDDVAIIAKNSGKFYLYGSPFFQRTKRSYPNKKILIEGIFNIVQSRHTKVEKIANFDAFICMRSNTFRVTDIINQNLFLKDLVEYVPILQLEFEKNTDFWEMISSANFIFLLDPDARNSTKFINPGLKIEVEKMEWISALANKRFVESMHVVKELSWQFEFNAITNVEAIAEMIIKTPNFSGSHTKLIKEYVQKELNRNFIIVSILKNEMYHIIDGNHRTISSLIKSDSNIFRILYAR